MFKGDGSAKDRKTAVWEKGAEAKCFHFASAPENFFDIVYKYCYSLKLVILQLN